MKINLNEFKDVLKKGTMNYIIDSIGLSIDKERIKCNMISSDHSALLFLDMPNNVIEGLASEVVLNFSEPNNKVKPYLEIMDEVTVPITITDNKININKQLKINFDDESVISVYGKDNPKNEIKFFTSLNVDDGFMLNYKKIQKIGSRFGKVYFVIEDNKLYIESTDKTNSYSNSVKFFIADVKHENLELCFKYKNFVNLMSLINVDEFDIKLSYVKDKKLGLIGLFKKDESERYFLMSMME